MAVVADRCVFFAAPQNASNLKVSAQQLDNFEPRKLIAPSAKRPKARQPLTLQKISNAVQLIGELLKLMLSKTCCRQRLKPKSSGQK